MRIMHISSAAGRECSYRSMATASSLSGANSSMTADQEPETVSCVFSLAEMDTRKGSYFSPTVRFTVRAAETFGRASAPIVSAAVRL